MNPHQPNPFPSQPSPSLPPFLIFVGTRARDVITDHSSAGRAEDCRVAWLSLGRWFDSGWSEFLLFTNTQNINQLYHSSFLLLSLKLDPGHLVESRQTEFFLRGLAVLQLPRSLQQRAELLRAALQLLLLVAHHRGHHLAPGGLALADLLDQVDRRGGHEAGRVVEELGLEEGEFEHVLGEVLVLGLEADDPAQRLEELVGRVDDEFEVQELDDARLHFQDLCGRELVGAADHQLPDLRHLVGLLELGGDVQGSHSHQLQLGQRHLLDHQVLVDQRHHREQRLGEHLVLVVQFAEPVDEFGPRLFGDSAVGGDVVGQPMRGLLPAAQKLHVLEEVLGHHLRVLHLQPLLAPLPLLHALAAVTLRDPSLVLHRGLPALPLQEGVVPLVPIPVLQAGNIANLPAKDAMLHVSVRLYYN